MSEREPSKLIAALETIEAVAELCRISRGKRDKLMGLTSAPAVSPPPPNGPEDFGATPPVECDPAPAKPPWRVVDGGGVPEPGDLPASLLSVPGLDPDLLPENFRP